MWETVFQNVRSPVRKGLLVGKPENVAFQGTKMEGRYGLLETIKKSDCHHIASVVCHAGGRCSENGAALLFLFWKFFLEKETIGMDTNVGRQAVSLFVRRAS